MPVFHDACGFPSHASSDDAQLLSIGWSCPHFPSPTRSIAGLLQHHKADSQHRAGLCRARRAARPAGQAAKHHRLAVVRGLQEDALAQGSYRLCQSACHHPLAYTHKVRREKTNLTPSKDKQGAGGAVQTQLYAICTTR